MSDRRKRYYVAAEFGAPKPYLVIERDTNTVVAEFVLERDAEKRATRLIRQKQNAPKSVVASLESTKRWYSVGKERVEVLHVVNDGRTTYTCTCSGSAGQLGCKHIDAVKAQEES